MVGDRGRVSGLTEKFGADFMWTAKGEKWLVQRKEVKDLLASVRDGRLAKEVAQMREGRGVLVVEGEVRWSTDGMMIGDRWGEKWSRRLWGGLQWSLSERGVWVFETGGLGETVDLVCGLEDWTKRERGRTLDRRPTASGMWGTKPGDRDWQRWLLQGFPGVGPELADRILDEFGGKLPLGLDTRGGKLEDVRGLGPKKIEQIKRLLE
jgi:ERCC4-type nuclease